MQALGAVNLNVGALTLALEDIIIDSVLELQYCTTSQTQEETGPAPGGFQKESHPKHLERMFAYLPLRHPQGSQK